MIMRRLCRCFSTGTATLPSPNIVSLKNNQHNNNKQPEVSLKEGITGIKENWKNRQKKKKKEGGGFCETIELALNLDIDPRKQNEQLRITVDLPNGTGKQIKVLAFSEDFNQIQLAKDAGCDEVGGIELIDAIYDGKKLIYDRCIATPSILPKLSKIAKILGPKGLMPSKKLETVVDDLSIGLKRARVGLIEVRADRAGTVRCGFGKVDMTDEAIIDNLKSIILSIENNKPTSLKGKKWFKSAYLSSTMGPSFLINLNYFDPKHVRFMAN